MSRTLPALLLLVLIPPLPAVAQPGPSQGGPPLPQAGTPELPTIVTADEAIAMERARVRDVLDRDCPPGQLDEEVIVCGRRPAYQRYRVPMAGPDISPGTRERAGDAQLYAMDAGSTRCSAVGRDQQCGGGLDVIGIGFAIVRGITQALLNRD
ncbi:MAG TPA: hypothetical protein VMG08_18450 [Allosphingosinicella sp.]|nr:hypothetical protein [Allosphingosinicella sp.]